jgi:pyrimidine-nucleoside phosphorylase
MDALSILQTKRRNLRPHTSEEIQWWIREYANDRIPEYQMAAWLMAVCWRGMIPEETATLCRCMVESGTTVQWGLRQTPYLVDKHSTGGVGDKVSLVLAPLVATLGVKVPMMAGRGLGHTGGTIDKLESIPGYRTTISIPEFQNIVSHVGCSIVAASSELCLADRKLYGLRDVTATVSSIPLQTSSIMCKKIAENPNSLILDVKYGIASFQSDRQSAEALAQSMIATGEANGLVPTTCLLTHMDSAIGTSIGNWLEIEECIQLLQSGKGSPDLVALVVVQAAQMLMQSGKYADKSLNDLLKLSLETLKSGKAYGKFQEMVHHHGGTLPKDNSCPHPHPKFERVVQATQSGYLKQFNGMTLGNLCVQLGAGRQVAEQSVDPMAGISFYKCPGDFVQPGDKIAIFQSNRSETILQNVCKIFINEIVDYSQEVVAIPFPISHLITSRDGTVDFVAPEFLMKI